MTEESKLVFRGKKSSAIISSLCELFNVSLETAADIFYRSETAVLIEDKVADLHCRSDKYLATLIWDEFQERNSQPL